MALAQLLPLPVAVRLALPSYAFIAWNGLFTGPAQLGPLLIAAGVSLAWAVAATTLGYLLFVRRDFTTAGHDGLGRRVLALLPVGALFAATAGILAATAPAAGITQDKVQQSVAPLPPAGRSAAPARRPRSAAGRHGRVHQGRRPRRDRRARQRLALRRLLAPARRRGHRVGDLPAGGAVAGVGCAPAPDRSRRRRRLRQPRAGEPLHVVPDARVAAALPGGAPGVRPGPGAGRVPPVRGIGRLTGDREASGPPGSVALSVVPNPVDGGHFTRSCGLKSPKSILHSPVFTG